jgi:hypothetical protein
MFLATCAVTLATVVVFGAFGGLVLLVGLNGVSERAGGVVIVAYALLVLGGTSRRRGSSTCSSRGARRRARAARVGRPRSSRSG